jgi:uncharacterized membrane protein
MSALLKFTLVARIYRLSLALYMKIAEPRVKRLIYFGIYVLLGIIGTVSAFSPNDRIQVLLGGLTLIYLYGGLIALGALTCMVSVLPGIWMFERAGLVALGTGIGMYSITLIALGASIAIAIIPTILILVFVLRWLDIKDYLLAPRKG